MAKWLENLSGKVSGVFNKPKIPIENIVLAALTSDDPRLLIRPLGNDWLCPFSGQRVEAPDWDGSAATLPEQGVIVEHLLALPSLQFEGEKVQMKSWTELVEIGAMIRLRESPSYRASTDQGKWICPHCMSTTDVLI